MRDDAKNQYAASLAQVHGIPFTIAIAHEAVSVGAFEQAGIDVSVNPRAVTAEEIVRFAHDPRTQQVAMLEGNRYEVLDVTTRETSRYIGMEFRDMPVHGSIIGAIVRNGAAIFPHGDDVLQSGDRVIIFTEAANAPGSSRRSELDPERGPRGSAARGGSRSTSRAAANLVGTLAKYLGLAALFPIGGRALVRRARVAVPRGRRDHERRRPRARAARLPDGDARRRPRGVPRRVGDLAARGGVRVAPVPVRRRRAADHPVDAYFEGMSAVHDDRRERRDGLHGAQPLAAHVAPVHAVARRHGDHRPRVAVLPRLRVGGRQIMESELPGPEIAALAERIRATRGCSGSSTSA